MSYAETLAPLLDSIRHPLALVLGPIEQLRANADPAQIPALDLLRHHARQAMADIDDLSELTELQMGLRSPQLSAFDCAPLIRGLVAALDGRLEERNLRLTFPNSGRQMPLYADPTRVEKGLITLMQAVIRGTPVNGHIQLRTSQNELVIRHTCKDDLPRGIGIVLTEALLGSLEIQREDAATERISCSMPTSSDVMPPPRSLSETWQYRLQPPPARAPLPENDDSVDKPTLLVVDDERDLLDFFAATLAEDFRVLCAADAATALTLALRHHPDLVLTDQNMPGTDGIGLVRDLRGQTGLESTRILLMTGRTDDAIRLAALKAGANDFLGKPFTTVELRTRLRSMFGSSQLERELAARNRALR